MISFLEGDVIEQLRTLPDCSVQCVVTSPPYFGLRDYGIAGQIGMEDTPELFVSKIVEVFREVKRVLRDDGTLWLNFGDSYAGHSGNTHCPELTGSKQKSNVGASHIEITLGNGLKHKDMIGIPWMVAFALRADGWYLRSDIIWSKPNPMPESVTDRPTKAHEYVFLLTKKAKYYYDADAVREPLQETPHAPGNKPKFGDVKRNDFGTDRMDKVWGNINGRNKRTVWEIATQPTPEAHFATFPEALVEPCIKAGSKIGDVILDPFGGSGTTAKVATELSRDCILIELNHHYIKIAKKKNGLNPLPLSHAHSLGYDMKVMKKEVW